MSILCDLFVNSHENSLTYKSALEQDRAVRLERFDPVEAKRLTPLVFGTLWAILLNEEWNVDKHMLINVAVYEDGESWLCQFQDEYVALLSQLDQNAINAAVDAWSQTEELSCAADNIRPVVEALVRLSRQAMTQSKGLYTWGSV